MIDRRRKAAIAILLSLARAAANEDAAATGEKSSAQPAGGHGTGLAAVLVAHGVEQPGDVRDGPDGQILIWWKLYLALAPDAEAEVLKDKGFEVVIYAPADIVDVAALAMRLRSMFSGAA